MSDPHLGSGSSANPNLVLTLVYFLTIAAILIGTAVYFIVMARITDPEVRLMELITTQREVQHLIDNLSSQFSNFWRLPLRWRSMKPYYTHQTLSWIFILALVASVVVLIVALALDLAQVARISTLTYVVSLNALFMVRQHLYYIRRTYLTYDAEHYLVLDTTKFFYFDWSVFNIVQIGILIIEFLQLLSFPIRDLLDALYLSKNQELNGNSDGSDTASFIIGIITMFANLSSKFYVIQFWFLVSVIGCIVLVMTVIHTYNAMRPHRPIAIYWVKYLLPLANLLYLPMLVMLIGSAACLSKIGTEDASDSSSGLLRCDSPSVVKPLYLALTVVAYTAGYVILTAFVTSFDRIPIKGEIHYKSQGVAFLKNMSMLLSIDFLLVANSYRHIRSILSLVIVLSMVCFNINTQPCFVEQINYWRTYGFCCILWVALIVTMLTNEASTLLDTGTGGVVSALAVGAVILLVLFITMRCIWRAPDMRELWFSKTKEPQRGVDISIEMADRGYFHNICVSHGCEAECTHVNSTSPTENENTSTTENDYYMQRYVPPHRRQEEWASERLRQRHRSSYTNQNQSAAQTRKWYVNIPRWMRLPWTRIALDSDERPPRPVLYAIVLALSVPYFLASLDQTVLSTLTPRVPNDQEELFQTSWVTSSYLASLNAFMLFYGKVADIFGPLPILVIASLIFLCGSVLTATSTTMAWLILARALAGLGAAGVISVTQAIAAEVGPWHERGQYMGILGAVFGLGTTIGPLVGGLVADSWTWRISFYANVPLVCVTLLVVLLVLRITTHPLPLSAKLGRVDFFGALMLVAGLMLLLLGLNWGGRVYPWVSPVVIICLTVGLLLLGVFAFIESKLALEPIIDARLFNIRNIALSIPIEMCVGAVFLNTTFNLPVYYSFTQNSSASESGVRMIPLACSVVVSSIVSGWLIARFSVYRLVTWAGTAVMTLGAGLLCMFDGNIRIAAQVPILMVLGSGIGCCIMGLLLTAQVSVRPADLAVTTALATFSQMMGGIMGLAFGSIVLESTTKHHLDKLIDLMPKYATDILRAQNDANEIWTMDVPPNVQQSIIRAYARGLQFNFALITCLGAVAVGLAAFLQGVSQHKAPPPMNGRGDTYASNAGEFARPGLDLNRLDLDDTTIVW
ncbi:hypothetical protein LPJ76_002887 [Coemansia sp. RSA 638]|nr:hypothetical protein LPJ76_002887 [Coemansia sp. RSA 638]